MPVPPDRYDEIRRKWIARHKWIFTFQDKRAQELARQIRDRDTERSGSRVDPADDDVLFPLLARTSISRVDAIVAGVAAILAPIGWALGRAVYKTTIELIPSDLRSYPIAAYAWVAVAAGAPLLLLYQPANDSLFWTLILPWLVAQIPATALAASLYGILEGWLAVSGARDLWPMRPLQNHGRINYGFQVDDMTRPPVFPIHHEEPPGDPSPKRAS